MSNDTEHKNTNNNIISQPLGNNYDTNKFEDSFKRDSKLGSIDHPDLLSITNISAAIRTLEGIPTKQDIGDKTNEEEKPENPFIYNGYNDDVASEDGEHTIFDNYIEAPATQIANDSIQNLNKLSKDYSNASHIIRFPLGTWVENRCKREPIMGDITVYNLKQGIYTIQYTNRKQE